MRITTWAEYGLICSLNLARRYGDGPVTGREIAAQERLPADYVEQILLRMRRAGIVTSVRGAHGGYVLARAVWERKWLRWDYRARYQRAVKISGELTA